MPLRVNGEVVRLAQGTPDVEEDVLEIESKTDPQVRLTELDQVDPKGRYRFRVSGDTLQVQRATKPKWADWETFIAISDSEGVVMDLTDDDLEEALQVLLLETVRLRELLSLAFGVEV